MISTCILINDCILQDFKPLVDVSTEEVKCVREMLCEYIVKETIDRKASSIVVHREFIVTRNVETHSVFFSQLLLPEKLA
jgi:predicted metal-binding transcription factor (methanogenesis marker protein 9)